MTIEQMRALQYNWDSYGAEPPNDLALSNLTRVLRLCRAVGMKTPNTIPSAEGGAACYFLMDGRYADIECFNDGSILSYRDGRNPMVRILKATGGRS